MHAPLQVVFRNMHASPAVETDVRDHLDHLSKRHDKIMHCQVVIEQRHHRHEQGNLFHVRVDVKVPGRELVADRDSETDPAHEDVYVAVRDAFDAVGRQLDAYRDRRRGE